MLIFLFQLLVRLTITAITLALRLALAVAALVGKLLGYLLGAMWRRWQSRHVAEVPLRAPERVEGQFLPPPLSPSTATEFAPRPLRPRPKR